MRPPPAVATTCPYCGVGCGVLAQTLPSRETKIAGDPSHPANFGRLCSKGAALGETTGLSDRLLAPRVGGEQVSWDVALERVAGAFTKTIARYGPDSVAFYVSGQLLTEDYYVANKLMKGFIGSANIDTNSRLCMASSVAGHKRAFGADTVPGTYEDLETADLVVLVGSNLAWCHPVLHQRLMAARVARPQTRIVAIDPRRTATTENADLHLAISPDTDVALFLGLLNHLSAAGAQDTAFVSDHTRGLDNALKEAVRWSTDAVAAATGLGATEIDRFFDWFARARRTVTVYSQGVNQSAAGTDKVNAIINAHLFTGRIGQVGMGPFSVTGQPNAMGGREVGGLANMLACHMDLENPSHREIVRRHWDAPRMARKPGLKAVDLFSAVREGRVKALWVMATNPAASLPDAAAVDEALKTVPFLAVSDVVETTDTLRHAHVALPAAAWGEKDGTVTNSERRISRQRAFLSLPGEARPDWAIIADVARKMGFAGFDYGSPREIFDEYASLSAIENAGSRDFTLEGLAGLTAEEYAHLTPVQWPVGRQAQPTTRFFANGGFFTPDRKARFVATPFGAPQRLEPRYPFVFNTGRVRDQWHTMTRTGRAPTLSQHFAEPFAEINPEDAALLGVAPAQLVRIDGPLGHVVVRVLVTDRQRPGSVFAPIHWTDETSANARIGRVVAAVTDPVSGQPALKSSRVAVRAFPVGCFGYAIGCKPLIVDSIYWARAEHTEGEALEFALASAPRDPVHFATRLLRHNDLVGAVDRAAGTARLAAFDGDRLLGAVYLSPAPVEVSRSFVAAHLARPCDRAAILSGRPPVDRPDPGPTVCACLGVGANTIIRAAENGAATLEAIGAATGAGTNCGSCRAEVSRLLAKGRHQSEMTEDARNGIVAGAYAH